LGGCSPGDESHSLICEAVLSHEGIALLAMGKFFSVALGGFGLLMPVLFNRYFAGQSSLPDVLKAGMFSENYAL
jgi:hypothetical protein